MVNRLILVIVIFCAACNSQKKAVDSNLNGDQQQLINDTGSNFFPVTTFLKGEIFEIKNGGITPIKRTTIGTKTDSTFVQISGFDSLFSAFTSPIIDTANLKKSFIEKKFLDQTLNAFTFTYEPLNNSADNFPFRHWDVYVDPESNKVTRIYLDKKVDEQTELKLFWESGKWCKIITVKIVDGKASVFKEEKISWSYEE